MATSSKLVQRLRALSMSMATLQITVAQYSRELDSLVELALCIEQHSLLPQPLKRLRIGRFIVDRATFSVSEGNRICQLGNTICFRLFECLASEPNRYFTRNELLAAVWDGQRRAATTIRSAVFELRSQFRKAGMDELAVALRSNGRAYGLMLDAPLRTSQRKTNG